MKRSPIRPGLGLGLLAALLFSGCATVAPPQDAAPPPPPVAEAPPAPSPDVVASSAATPETSVSAPAAVIVADPEIQPPIVAAADPKVPTELSERDLWIRIRKGFSVPDLEGDLVRDREQWYASRPDYVQRMTARSARYLFHIVEEIERRGMPTELALLPFIESAFNPQALSTASASGMWQFIPSTGKDFDLKQNIFRDDRRDVLASTRAALDYLGKLYGMFGDWHLALAAYNWGEGSVQRAVARNRKAGLPTDYQSLRMPNETRYYVPKLQAVKNLVASPQEFGLELQAIENHPYFLTVAVQRDIDVDLASRLAGLPIEEFRALNPQMNKPVILAAGVPHILLPYENANRFIRNLADHKGPLASWTAWVVPKTMSPREAAEQVGMSEDHLRELNRIPLRMLVKGGSTLLISRNERKHHADVSEDIADNATMALTPDVPPLRRTVVRAGKRDTVASIARRYRLQASQVAEWNHVGASASFARGQNIVIYLPNARSAQVRRLAARDTEARETAKPVVRTRSAATGKPARPQVASRKPASTKVTAVVRKPAAPSKVRVARH